MKERFAIFLIKSTLFFSAAHLIIGQGVVFPGDVQLGSSCRLPEGRTGTCKNLKVCPEALNRYQSQSVSHCYIEGLDVVVCCPSVYGPSPVLNPGINPVKIRNISPPNITQFECGRFSNYALYGLDFDFVDPYRLNNILLDVQEANHEVLEVKYEGNLVSFFKWTDGQEVYNEARGGAAVGGKPARYVVAQYMALLGESVGGKHSWYCDGILLNERWVLTAAHCMQSSRNINVVRLGEYDYNNDTDAARPKDFGIIQVVIYPQYRPPIAYHDLALLKLSKRVRFSRFINPICLPWGDFGRHNLVGSRITLTGWGAIIPGDPGVSLLQEVNVTVFETSSCDRSYSSLPFYSTVWPSGITKGETLCAGDPSGGKDACQGDSGGPVVYFIDTEINYRSRYMLAGVVSKGHGCGAAEFPGLYVDIRHGSYLSWIKQVAFRGI